jgi:hypothetical protein
MRYREFGDEIELSPVAYCPVCNTSINFKLILYNKCPDRELPLDMQILEEEANADKNTL